MCVMRTQFVVFEILEQNNNEFVNINAHVEYFTIRFIKTETLLLILCWCLSTISPIYHYL